MSIKIDHGVLRVSGADDKIRQKGREIVAFLDDYTMIDIETTGLSTYRDRVTELGGVRVRGGQVAARFSCLVRYPGENTVPAFITRLNGITQEQIEEKGVPVKQAIQTFRAFIGDDVVAGYNVNFDLNFVYDLAEKYGVQRLDNDYVDVLRLSRVMFPHQRNSLLAVMRRMGIADSEAHHGLQDSLDTISVYQKLRNSFDERLLHVARSRIKNADLTSASGQLSCRNPVRGKSVVLTGNFAARADDLGRMIYNLGGSVEGEVDKYTNYLVAGDRDYFDKHNAQVARAGRLIRQGARIRRLSETFFLNMLADWARN